MDRIQGADRIRLACHKVLADKSLLKKQDTTYCNFGIFRILSEFDKQMYFWNKEANRIMLANEMYDKLNSSNISIGLDSDIFYNSNSIFIACTKGIKHGHIAIIYPSYSRVYSTKWGKKAPLVANIGHINGVMGLNWAFAEEPKIFYFCDIKDIDNAENNKVPNTL